MSHRINCYMCNAPDRFHRTEPIRSLQIKMYLNSIVTSILQEIIELYVVCKFLPVSSVASAIKNVLYDIRTNNADSSSGKSRMRVNLVMRAVIQPIAAPIISESVKIRQKSPTARKKAFVSNSPVLDKCFS